MSDWDDTTNVASIDEVTARPLERDRAYLIVLAGTNVGEMFKVEAGVTIGRGRTADVRLLDDGISREHASIRVEGDSVTIRDLGSSNGTYCNGVPIQVQELRDGDKIQVGRTTILKFTYHDDLDESFQRQMYDSALRDGLTTAFNKRYFMERLTSEMTFALRHEVPLSILMMDIDHFKEVNDEYGHLAGDAVLRELGVAFGRTVRNEDVFARYGGEEFGVICRATPQVQAAHLAERIRRVAEELNVRYNHRQLPITVSIGVAGLPDTIASDAKELISTADRALYAAKHAGRNRVVVGIPPK